jgi:hypothetical protein
MHLHVYTNACFFTYISVCEFVGAGVYTSMCVRFCVCECMCLCLGIPMKMDIYMHI